LWNNVPLCELVIQVVKSNVRVAVLALLLATGSAAAWAADSLKVGIASDYFGPYVDLGGPASALAARMAVQDSSGTVLGRPIEIVSASTQNKPDVASTFVRNWFDNESVEAVADGSASSVGLTIRTLAEQKHKIYLNSGGFSGAFSGPAGATSSFQFQLDLRALAVVDETVKSGGLFWYFVTANYAFGIALENAAAAVKTSGGTVLRSSKVPLGAADFSSYLLRAQSSGAQVIALASAGNNFFNTMKQTTKFGRGSDGKSTISGLRVFISDVEALGLEAAQRLRFGDAAYRNEDDGTRAWSRHFMEQHGGKPPTTVHAMT